MPPRASAAENSSPVRGPRSLGRGGREDMEVDPVAGIRCTPWPSPCKRSPGRTRQARDRDLDVDLPEPCVRVRDALDAAEAGKPDRLQLGNVAHGSAGHDAGDIQCAVELALNLSVHRADGRGIHVLDHDHGRLAAPPGRRTSSTPPWRRRARPPDVMPHSVIVAVSAHPTKGFVPLRRRRRPSVKPSVGGTPRISSAFAMVGVPQPGERFEDGLSPSDGATGARWLAHAFAGTRSASSSTAPMTMHTSSPSPTFSTSWGVFGGVNETPPGPRTRTSSPTVSFAVPEMT